MKRLSWGGILFCVSCIPAPPEDADLLYHEAAHLLSRERKPEAALRLLNRAISLDPSHREIRILRGAVHRILGHPGPAIEDYSSVIAREPGFLPARLNRGLLLAETGRTAEAESDFTEAIRRSPESVEAHLHRSRLYRSLGRIAEAEADATQARTTGARMAGTFFTEGIEEYALGNLDRALLAFSFTILLDPDHVRARVARGAILLLRSRTQEALQDLDRAVAADPDDAEARFYRGSGLLATGRSDAALEDFERAIALDPSRSDFHRLRGIVLHRHRNDPEGAARALRRAVELDSECPEAHQTLALLYQSEELHSEAEREFIRSLSIRATPEGLRLLARLYAEMDRRDDAVETYRKAIRLSREEPEKASLEQEIEELQSRKPGEDGRDKKD